MSVTEKLASYVANSHYDDIPADVRKEAGRAIFNYLGCALGGSIEPPLTTLGGHWYNERGIHRHHRQMRGYLFDPSQLANGQPENQ